jgi:hypothetical protein
MIGFFHKPVRYESLAHGKKTIQNQLVLRVGAGGIEVRARAVVLEEGSSGREGLLLDSAGDPG